MKYYVMHISNGDLQIPSITEWGNLDKAKAKFHEVCNTLWGEDSVITGYVVILDNQFDIVEDYKEYINHNSQPESTP